MAVRWEFNGLATVKSTLGKDKQRLKALFLFVLFSISVLVPPASAVAATITNENQLRPPTKDHIAPFSGADTKPDKFNHPGGMNPTVSKQKAAADAKPSTGTPLAQLSKDKPAQGEKLQGVNLHPKVTPRELTEKRTATSTQFIDADGSMKSRQYFAPKFFQKDGAWATIDNT